VKQKRAKEGKNIPSTPEFEPQVSQCLVGAAGRVHAASNELQQKQ